MERFRDLRQFGERVQLGLKRRRPPKGSTVALAEPPRWPVPLQGGAAAPLEFE